MAKPSTFKQTIVACEIDWCGEASMDEKKASRMFAIVGVFGVLVGTAMIFFVIFVPFDTWQRVFGTVLAIGTFATGVHNLRLRRRRSRDT